MAGSGGGFWLELHLVKYWYLGCSVAQRTQLIFPHACMSNPQSLNMMSSCVLLYSSTFAALPGELRSLFCPQLHSVWYSAALSPLSLGSVWFSYFSMPEYFSLTLLLHPVTPHFLWQLSFCLLVVTCVPCCVNLLPTSPSSLSSPLDIYPPCPTPVPLLLLSFCLSFPVIPTHLCFCYVSSSILSGPPPWSIVWRHK